MERIGEAVERELARGGGSSRPPASGLAAAWPEIVGESVARNAWPLRIAGDGTLHVATSSSTWAFELDRLGPEILEKIAGLLGSDAPTSIRFAVGPVPEQASADHSTTASPAPQEIPPAIAAEADRAAAEIDDPELSELARRAASASLSRPPSDRRF
jgi:hypothetical protein